jgi:hypothetical protein
MTVAEFENVLALRDYFAGQALRVVFHARAVPIPMLAAEAYELADAMLAERLRTQTSVGADTREAGGPSKLAEAAVTTPAVLTGDSSAPTGEPR